MKSIVTHTAASLSTSLVRIRSGDALGSNISVLIYGRMELLLLNCGNPDGGVQLVFFMKASFLTIIQKNLRKNNHFR